MSDQDIFNQEQPKPNAETLPPVQEDLFGDKLNKIVNENGLPKYKDVNTALDALIASQQFISTLTTEKKSMQEENELLKQKLEEIGDVEDLINRVRPNADTPPKVETKTAPSVVSEEVIANTVQDILSKREREASQNTNLNTVISAVTKQYGDQAGAHIRKRAEELGTTTDALRAMAMTQPHVAMEVLVGKTSKSVTPSRSQTVPPHVVPNDNEYPEVKRGVARGGYSNKELAEVWNKSKEYTNKRIGLENS